VTGAGLLTCLDGALAGLAVGGGPVNNGFAGLAGRGMYDFVGDAILIGDVGRVREL